VILDGVKGKGHYVGTYLAWTQTTDGWWGEGEIKFYLDGDKDFPTICGTGTEDYFGGAWGFYGPDEREETYTTAFLGLAISRRADNEPARHGMYRWHVMDPVRFEENLKVTIQALGWGAGGKYRPLTDEIASTAFWYQRPPQAPFPPLPGLNERIERLVG
jgi:hypothetical protein